MGQERDILKEPGQVIEEIEVQLDKLRHRKIDDIERELVARINQEKEAARRRKEEVEREFEKERGALEEYRDVVREAEKERDGLIARAREHFDKIVRLQAEIESLAKATVEEIRNVTDLQKKIEELRGKTAERAAFLKTDLRERFGIVADVFDEQQKTVAIDLDQELEKLKKIKELLAVESAAAGLGAPTVQAGDDGEFASLASGPPPELKIPEIQDLIADSARVAEEGPPSGEAAAEPVARTSAAAGPAAEESEEAVCAALESCRKSEPANGSGEIHYFQKDGKGLIDGESLFSAIDRTIDEARRLSAKLGRTESPKEQFFIKQELINWQEGLRALFLRIVKMIEKKVWALPAYTGAILNTQTLRGLLERLSMENWSNPEEFLSFTKTADEMKGLFIARITPRGPYLKAMKDEIESK
jgi:FtsZ-binding cell division protein ZapB